MIVVETAVWATLLKRSVQMGASVQRLLQSHVANICSDRSLSPLGKLDAKSERL